MQYTLALLGLATAALANPFPQEAVTENVAPEESTPEGCQPSYEGQFQIQVTNVSSPSTKRSFLNKRQQEDATTLLMTLADGVLVDSEDRTGYIAANRQFQFDGPPQAGAVYTSGWSVCGNGSLALGDDAIFYQCLSGTFYNLYDEAQAEQCSQVYITVLNADPATPVPTGAPVDQIDDGQIQASTSVRPVSQIPDGQIQATTVPAVSQIPDGQIQAPTSTVAPVEQIPDGQIQAPTSTVAPVEQIPDGQIQAPTSTVAPVEQIPDGQIQAPTSGMPTMPANGTTGVATASPTIQPFEGAAASHMVAGSLMAVVVGLFGLVAL